MERLSVDIRAVCIEGHCFSTDLFSDEMKKNLINMDWNGDRIINYSYYYKDCLSLTSSDKKIDSFISGWDNHLKAHVATSLDLAVTTYEYNQSIKFQPAMVNSLKRFQEEFSYKVYKSDNSGYAFDVFILPIKNINQAGFVEAVIGELPNVLNALQLFGLFTENIDDRVAIIVRDQSKEMDKDNKVAYAISQPETSTPPVILTFDNFNNKEKFGRVLRHELVHSYLTIFRTEIPNWFNEGFAEYVENYGYKAYFPKKYEGRWTEPIDQLKVYNSKNPDDEGIQRVICEDFFIFLEEKHSKEVIKLIIDQFLMLRKRDIFPEWKNMLDSIVSKLGYSSFKDLDKDFHNWIQDNINRQSA